MSDKKPRESEVNTVQKTTLDNGLRVLTEEIDSVRSLAVGVWIKTGSRDESDELAGITHFLEHMLFKGTDYRTAYEIAQSMESVGGYLNAFTSSEFTCYFARCLDTKLDVALDVLSDMVLNSSLPEKEIEKEKKVVLEEMKMYRDNPEDYIVEEFIGQIFQGHPLGRPIIGYENTVSEFTREGLFEYLKQHYRPYNIILSVAGNATHEQVLETARRYFTNKRQEPSGGEPDTLNTYQPNRNVLTKPIEQTHYIMGRRALSTGHPDRYKLLLANTILGGGMSSRLHQHIREDYGYCYSIHSFNQGFMDSGIFGIYAGTDREYVDHLKELVQAELWEMRDKKVSENELAEAKAQLKGKLLLGQESMSNRMMRLAKSELYYGRYISLDELIEQIDAVDREELRQFAEEFFREDQFSETLLLPDEGGEDAGQETNQ